MGRSRGFILAAAIFLVAGNGTYAGGLGDDHGDGTDSVFFGVVKDTRGATITGARVNVTFKKMTFTTVTDAIGGYRIVTITDPDQSEVSCSMAGYTQKETMRRTPPGAQAGPVEIDCTLQRAP
jgi:hypothetical protein